MWDMDWIDVTEDSDSWWTVGNVGNFLTSWENVSFSRRNLLLGVSIPRHYNVDDRMIGR
jgi:hypothetical protein